MSYKAFLCLFTVAAAIVAAGSALPPQKSYAAEPLIHAAVESSDLTQPPAMGPYNDERLFAGRIVAVDHTAGRVTLDYRPIPQLYLDGGVRIFRVKNPKALLGLTAGDKIRFELARAGRSYVVTRIENSN